MTEDYDFELTYTSKPLYISACIWDWNWVLCVPKRVCYSLDHNGRLIAIVIFFMRTDQDFPSFVLSIQFVVFIMKRTHNLLFKKTDV